MLTILHDARSLVVEEKLLTGVCCVLSNFENLEVGLLQLSLPIKYNVSGPTIPAIQFPKLNNLKIEFIVVSVSGGAKGHEMMHHWHD